MCFFERKCIHFFLHTINFYSILTFAVRNITRTILCSEFLFSVSVPDNYVLSLEFGLADFTFTPDLYDKNSARFKWLSDRFCKDVSFVVVHYICAFRFI